MKGEKWDIRKYLVEIKVGGFFLIAIILLFITLLSIREVTFWKGTYILKVKFYFAEGLRPSSPVRFCGVDVGEVKRVEVKEENNQPIVYVHAKIQEGVRIPKNCAFIINSLSLFGEKYLEITSPQNIEGYLKKDEIVEGISPIPLFTVLSNFHKTMREIEEFVKEGKLKQSFENILANTEDITLSIKGLLSDIKNKEGTVGRFLYDDSVYRKTEELITGLEEFVDDLKGNPWKLLYKPRETKKSSK